MRKHSALNVKPAQLKFMASCCCSGNPGVTQREMEVLQESVLARGRPEQCFKALLVNFKKLQASSNPPPTAAAELEVCESIDV